MHQRPVEHDDEAKESEEGREEDDGQEEGHRRAVQHVPVGRQSCPGALPCSSADHVEDEGEPGLCPGSLLYYM